jgi:hypothetical protein
MRRSSGVSLLELIVAISLLSLMFLLMGRMGIVALRWRETAETAVRAESGADRLRRRLVAASGVSRPVDKLTAGGRSFLRSDERLLLEGGDGAALIVERTGTRLVAWTVSRGLFRREELSQGVERVKLEVLRRKDGTVAGLGYELRFRGRGPVERGFIAQRAEVAR